MSGGHSNTLSTPAPGEYNGIDSGYTGDGQTPMMKQFATTTEGQQYAAQIASNATKGFSYYKSGNGYVATDTSFGGGVAGHVDATGLMTAYNAWAADNANAQSGWSSYADLVAKQGGGEGTGTILSSQQQPTTPYQSILAAQAQIGNPAKINSIGPQIAAPKMGVV